PSQPKTAIDNLDTSYLSSKNLYLDIVRKDADDTIDIAVKCEGGLMYEDQVRAFVMEMVAEVEGFLGDGKEGEGVVVGRANENRGSEKHGEDGEDRQVETRNGKQSDRAIADVGREVVKAVE
ncbi:MAG: hypothetical protein Q9192_008196, partial [Flavoplaca navasiana]